MGERHKVKPKNKMTKIILKKVERYKHAQKEHNNVWRMSSFFGLIGFSVVLPLAGLILLGDYLDEAYPANFSWTFSGILAGLAVGLYNAWHWIKKEEDEIEEEKK